MFFPFLAAAIVAAALVKLGALSVMVSVLSLALKAMVIAAMAFAILYVVSRINRP